MEGYASARTEPFKGLAVEIGDGESTTGQPVSTSEPRASGQSKRSERVNQLARTGKPAGAGDQTHRPEYEGQSLRLINRPDQPDEPPIRFRRDARHRDLTQAGSQRDLHRGQRIQVGVLQLPRAGQGKHRSEQPRHDIHRPSQYGHSIHRPQHSLAIAVASHRTHLRQHSPAHRTHLRQHSPETAIS